jgi:hypothetical protein
MDDMPQQSKRVRTETEKRAWSTPHVEEIRICEDVVQLLRNQNARSAMLDRLAMLTN